jgi:hypothetical protein
MARSKHAPLDAPIQMRETSNLLIDRIQLAMHGQSIRMWHKLNFHPRSAETCNLSHTPKETQCPFSAIVTMILLTMRLPHSASEYGNLYPSRRVEHELWRMKSLA